MCVSFEPIHGEDGSAPGSSQRRPVIANSSTRDDVNSVQYKCVLSRPAQTKVSQHHSEIKGGYSSCWWLIDTQVTGCMSKLPFRATSYRYIFPTSNNCLCIAIFSFKAVPGQSHRYTFGLIYIYKLKTRKAQSADYWGLLEVTTGPLNDKLFSFSHIQGIIKSLRHGNLSAVVICCLSGPSIFSTQTVIRYLGQINRIANIANWVLTGNLSAFKLTAQRILVSVTCNLQETRSIQY